MIGHACLDLEEEGTAVCGKGVKEGGMKQGAWRVCVALQKRTLCVCRCMGKGYASVFIPECRLSDTRNILGLSPAC